MFKVETFTGGIAATNGWLLQSDHGCLLVDAPEGIADWLEERGLAVGGLLLTHQHFDHVMDAAAVKRRHGCPVFAWAEFSRRLTLEQLFGAATGSGLVVPEFEVDEVLESRSSVIVCGHDWNLLHIPGHSADSVCFHHMKQRVVFGGDVLFEGGVGRTDLPGGSLSLLLKGIQKHLLSLPDETQILPGHGRATTLGRERLANAFLSEL